MTIHRGDNTNAHKISYKLARTALVPLQLSHLRRSLYALYSAVADVVAATTAIQTANKLDFSILFPNHIKVHY